jgi:hypothetical protein
MGTGEMHTEIWWAVLRRQTLVVDGTIILKWIFKKWTGEAGAGLIGLGIGTGGRLLWMR